MNSEQSCGYGQNFGEGQNAKTQEIVSRFLRWEREREGTKISFALHGIFFRAKSCFSRLPVKPETTSECANNLGDIFRGAARARTRKVVPYISVRGRKDKGKICKRHAWCFFHPHELRSGEASHLPGKSNALTRMFVCSSLATGGKVRYTKVTLEDTQCNCDSNDYGSHIKIFALCAHNSVEIVFPSAKIVAENSLSLESIFAPVLNQSSGEACELRWRKWGRIWNGAFEVFGIYSVFQEQFGVIVNVIHRSSRELALVEVCLVHLMHFPHFLFVVTLKFVRSYDGVSHAAAVEVESKKHVWWDLNFAQKKPEVMGENLVK